jgi:hypothetical protein
MQLMLSSRKHVPTTKQSLSRTVLHTTLKQQVLRLVHVQGMVFSCQQLISSMEKGNLSLLDIAPYV